MRSIVLAGFLPAACAWVFLRILVHNHEHMGQMIAYARIIGVTPQWAERE